MTYNFDPERWLDDRKAWLVHRVKVGEIDQETCKRELLELERRYEEMVARLDGSFQIPGRS